MKKILIMVLSAIASLGVAFGASVVASADEVGTALNISSLDELKGKTIVFNNEIYSSYCPQGTISFNFTSNDVSYTSIVAEDGKSYIWNYNLTQAFDSDYGWNNESFRTITISEDTTFVDNWTYNGTLEDASTIYFFNNYARDITPAPPEPEPAGNLWTSILTGIGGFLSGMFALISGAFTGVVSVFYANNTATIILQALIFAAAASLVAAAVYVIVRLIKSAVARLRGGVGAAGGSKRYRTETQYSISDGRGGFRDVSKKEYRRFVRRRK